MYSPLASSNSNLTWSSDGTEQSTRAGGGRACGLSVVEPSVTSLINEIGAYAELLAEGVDTGLDVLSPGSRGQIPGSHA